MEGERLVADETDWQPDKTGESGHLPPGVQDIVMTLTKGEYRAQLDLEQAAEEARQQTTPSVSVTTGPRPTPPKPDQTWKQDGLCHGLDPETFHPDPEDTSKVEVAKKICRQCVKREICLESAMDNYEKLGIWGGLDARERQSLRRRRLRAKKN